MTPSLKEKIQQAADQYGDAEKAEAWSCVKVAREALEQYSNQVGK